MAAAKRSGTAPLPVNAALRSTLAENFRSARIASGLTQKQLGELAQVSRDYVGQIENATANVSIDILANLAKFLNVSPAWGGRPNGAKTHGSVLHAISRVELACRRRRPVSKEPLKAEFDIAHRQDPLDCAVAQFARQGEDIGGDIMQLLVLRRHPIQHACLSS